MFSIFLDERTEDLPAGRRFMTGSVGIPASAWSREYKAAIPIGKANRRDRFSQVLKVLDACNGFASITYADLAHDLIRTGEIDGAADIPRMARTDHVWSLCALFSAVPVLKLFHSSGGACSEIEIYHDQKNLRSEHRTALEAIFKGQFVQIANSLIKDKGLNGGEGISVSAVIEVSKASSVVMATELQLGVLLPDYICAHKNVLQSQESGRFTIFNATERVKSILAQFDN